jgi:hypothetical protein
MTQYELGLTSAVRLDQVSLVESGSGQASLGDVIPMCSILGVTLQVVPNDPESGPTHSLDTTVARRWYQQPEPAIPSELAEALEVLADVYHASRRRPRAVIVVDYAYANQVVDLVWGAFPGIDDDWADLPTWRDVPVTLAPARIDTAELLRSPSTPRWHGPIAEIMIAPSGLPEGGADTYRRLRTDGYAPDRARAVAELIVAR